MTIAAFPINAAAGVPAYSSQQFRQAMATLLNPGATGLSVQEGVRPGPGLDVTLAGSTITITAGAAVIQGGSSTAQGGYMLLSDASVTKTLTAANATNPRVDLVYARIRDTDADASGARDGDIIYLAGTAGASPVAPTPPDPSVTVLATISVPTSGGGSPVVSYSSRAYTAAAGAVTYGISPPPNPFIGQLWDLAGLRRWDGSTWNYLRLDPLVTDQATQPSFGTTGAWVAFTSAQWNPITVQVPASGKIWFSIGAALQNINTTSSTGWIGWGASGGYTEGPSEANGLSTYGARTYATRRVLRSGLTPGASVVVTPYWQVSSAGTPTTVTRITNGQLVVEPVPA